MAARINGPIASTLFNCCEELWYPRHGMRCIAREIWAALSGIRISGRPLTVGAPHVTRIQPLGTRLAATSTIVADVI